MPYAGSVNRPVSDPLYLFCLTPSDTSPAPVGHSIDGSHPLERLELDGLTAVVSAISREEFIGPEAEARLQDLRWVGPRALRHQAVIRELMEQGPVIPVRFATLFSDAGALRDSIAPHRDALLAFLSRTRDQAEWSVKALYDRAGVLARLTDRAMAGREGELTALAPGRRYFEEQKLHKAAESELGKTLTDTCRAVYAELGKMASDACELRLQSKDESGLEMDMAANWAFLVSGTVLEALKGKVEALSGDGNPAGLSLRMSGPWPPYSFSPKFDASG